MASAQISLTVRHSPSALDTRRGVVRLHPEVLDALGLRPWDAVRLTGARVSAALAAAGDSAAPTGMMQADDVTMSNIGITDGSEVTVAPAEVARARHITVSGSKLATAALAPETVRLALLGKVVTTGDAVSLMPQDIAPPPGADLIGARSKLAAAIGTAWTSELLTVTDTDPGGVVTVHPSTVVSWRDGARPAGPTNAPVGTPADARDGTTGHTLTSVRAERFQEHTSSDDAGTPESPAREEQAVPIADLAGAREAARTLVEWFELAFQRPELLRKLGAAARLGVLVTGPEGVGKATMIRSAVHEAGADLVELAAPAVAVLEAGATANRLAEVVARAISSASRRPAVLLLTDVDTLLPATQPPPVATIVLDALREAVDTSGLAVVATSAHPESVDPRLRGPGLLDRELSVPLPESRTRTELLRVLLRDVPVERDVDLGAIADHAPGFVAADLVALRREAALRAALRQRDTEQPRIGTDDLLGALETVRPTSMSTSETLRTGGLSLDDVGDMAEVKQSLTEAVLWPLQYPDSFARLGVDPPRGVLLYGPPGCGKTYLIRALAGSGRLNVFSVKGAELMNKWVGESERAVRELFRRAAEAAPAMVFLDEVDALAPQRGQSGDSGAADRVVAALLTELDGVQPRRDVVVLGATNRPDLVDTALRRPGRLERLVYVPPPDAEARAEILRSASRNTPLRSDVNLDELAAALEGYSAADCAALVREAALTAMRESLDAADVGKAHLTAASEAVRPSLDPAQLAALQAYADNE